MKNQSTKRDRYNDGFSPNIVGIDLFCGVGGLTHGLQKGGVKIIAGVDVDPDCRFAYEANNDAEFIEKDVHALNGAELKALFPKNAIKVLAGCAPCQPFSTYSRRFKKHHNNKWDLLLDFGRLVEEVNPELITMENVPQLQDYEVFQSFLSKLKGYFIWYKTVDCLSYDVPQTRKRLVLLASKFAPIELIEPTCDSENPKTVRDAVFNLPPLLAGETDADDPLHTSCSLTPINMKRIKASVPGGTWRDWPTELRAKCHLKKSGQTYPSVYGRMAWDSPAPTMTTQCFGFGNGRFGHPTQDRAISLREAAIIQTFPKEYKFVPVEGNIKFSTLGRLIGNAVPVRLGEVVALSIKKHIQHLELIR